MALVVRLFVLVTIFTIIIESTHEATLRANAQLETSIRHENKAVENDVIFTENVPEERNISSYKPNETEVNKTSGANNVLNRGRVKFRNENTTTAPVYSKTNLALSRKIRNVTLPKEENDSNFVVDSKNVSVVQNLELKNVSSSDEGENVKLSEMAADDSLEIKDSEQKMSISDVVNTPKLTSAQNSENKTENHQNISTSAAMKDTNRSETYVVDYDHNIEKYTSADFHDVNNVYQISSPNQESKYGDVDTSQEEEYVTDSSDHRELGYDLLHTEHDSSTMNYQHLQLTTPESRLFDTKHKLLEDSIKSNMADFETFTGEVPKLNETSFDLDKYVKEPPETSPNVTYSFENVHDVVYTNSERDGSKKREYVTENETKINYETSHVKNNMDNDGRSNENSDGNTTTEHTSETPRVRLSVVQKSPPAEEIEHQDIEIAENKTENIVGTISIFEVTTQQTVAVKPSPRIDTRTKSPLETSSDNPRVIISLKRNTVDYGNITEHDLKSSENKRNDQTKIVNSAGINNTFVESLIQIDNEYEKWSNRKLDRSQKSYFQTTPSVLDPTYEKNIDAKSVNEIRNFHSKRGSTKFGMDIFENGSSRNMTIPTTASAWALVGMKDVPPAKRNISEMTDIPNNTKELVDWSGIYKTSDLKEEENLLDFEKNLTNHPFVTSTLQPRTTVLNNYPPVGESSENLAQENHIYTVTVAPPKDISSPNYLNPEEEDVTFVPNLQFINTQKDGITITDVSSVFNKTDIPNVKKLSENVTDTNAITNTTEEIITVSGKREVTTEFSTTTSTTTQKQLTGATNIANDIATTTNIPDNSIKKVENYTEFTTKPNLIISSTTTSQKQLPGANDTATTTNIPDNSIKKVENDTEFTTKPNLIISSTTNGDENDSTTAVLSIDVTAALASEEYENEEQTTTEDYDTSPVTSKNDGEVTSVSQSTTVNDASSTDFSYTTEEMENSTEYSNLLRSGNQIEDATTEDISSEVTSTTQSNKELLLNTELSSKEEKTTEDNYLTTTERPTTTTFASSSVVPRKENNATEEDHKDASMKNYTEINRTSDGTETSTTESYEIVSTTSSSFDNVSTTFSSKEDDITSSTTIIYDDFEAGSGNGSASLNNSIIVEKGSNLEHGDLENVNVDDQDYENELSQNENVSNSETLTEQDNHNSILKDNVTETANVEEKLLEEDDTLNTTDGHYISTTERNDVTSPIDDVKLSASNSTSALLGSTTVSPEYPRTTTAGSSNYESTLNDDGNEVIRGNTKQNQEETVTSELPVETTTLLDATTTEVSEEPEGLDNDGDEDPGSIAAIIISTVGVIALVILVALLYVMRRRHQKLTYAQRCTPVGLDAYSLDNVSVYNSVRRKGALRASKRSYGNPGYEHEGSISHPLTFPGLANFASDRAAVYAEFEEVPTVTARANEVPPGCEEKNRFANVVPLPETRVELSKLAEDETSTYINANYVDGPMGVQRFYIATQAPTPNTVNDFWRMVWEQQSRVVLQITNNYENGVEKCVNYLPPSETIDCHRLFGDFKVTLKQREVRDAYVISRVHLCDMSRDLWREVVHLWYGAWPERGVPAECDTLIAFLMEARNFAKTSNQQEQSKSNGENNNTTPVKRNDRQSVSENKEDSKASSETTTTLDGKTEPKENDSNVRTDGKRASKELPPASPIVVHCSPGTGRTGAVLCCDLAIREYDQGRRVDVPKTVARVRRCRAGAVQTKEQYEYIYQVLNVYATKLTGGVLDSI